MEKPITIVGCGPGAEKLLTAEAIEAVANADCLIGSKRLLELFPDGAEKISIGADVALAISEIEKRVPKRKVALLVSGDPGLCSIATPVVKKFGHGSCRLLPGISSVQLAFASIGLDWYGAKVISAHAKDPCLNCEDFLGESKIAVLGGRENSIKWIVGLAKSLGEERELIVFENLSLQSEKITTVDIGELENMELSSLVIVLIIEKELLR